MKRVTVDLAVDTVSYLLMLLLLLSYHRRLRKTSEALLVRVEGGRDNHCWCMCVVSNGYGDEGGGRDGGGG